LNLGRSRALEAFVFSNKGPQPELVANVHEWLIAGPATVDGVEVGAMGIEPKTYLLKLEDLTDQKIVYRAVDENQESRVSA
jgi:hypothetical protein